MRPDIAPAKIVLAVSFAPLLVKAISYVTLAGYAPLLVFCLFGGLVVWGLRRPPKTRVRVVKAWALALILWGLARFTVMGLFMATSVSEAHIESNFTVWFVILSLGHIVMGIYLFRNAKVLT